MDLIPGLLIGNKVRLERLLGEGGMGSVWRAEHVSLQTSVAVKFISFSLVDDENAQKRFTTEATSAAQIKSPHVVQVLDHGVFGGRPYIVMELLEGEDLSERAARLGRLPIGEVAEIIRQTARALTAAHALGIVHRDIKPANIFITQSADEAFVKVLDFGIAKRSTGENHAKTATGQMVGTPYYMSPEQVMEGGVVDYRTDVWALAVAAYECLTGTLPFNGAQLGAIYVAIHSCVFPRPTAVNPALPPEIDAFFGKAFNKDISQRYATAKELADALVTIALGPQRASLPSINVSAGRGSDAAFARTDVLHHQTLAGTASDSGTRRRKTRRTAALIGGGAAGLVAILAVVVGLSKGSGDGSSSAAPAMEPATEAAGSERPASTVMVTPTGAAPDIAPAAVESGASAASGAPVASTAPAASGAPSAKAVEIKPSGVHTAPPLAAGTTAPTKASTPSSSATGTPKRRDHGF